MLTIRLAIREVMARRRVSAIIVFTAGSAMAVHAALFAIVDGLLFKPLPYRQAHRIVHLDAPVHVFSPIPERAREILTVAASSTQLTERCIAKLNSPFQPGSAALVDWQIRSAAVSAGCFSLFGVRPLVGRTLLDSDVDTRPRPLVISQDLWERLGADEQIVNRSIELPGTLDGSRWIVIGVMPRAFSLPVGTNAWYAYSPREFSPSLVPDFARVTDDASIASIRAQLPRVTITPLREYVRPREALALGYLFLGTSLLYIVASIQVGSLLLSRASARIKESAICLSLGAPRRHLRLRLLVESAILAMSSLLLAAVIAAPLTTTIVRWLPAPLIVGYQFGFDGRTLLSTGLVAGMGIILWSALPFEVLRRFNPSDVLRGEFAGGLGRVTRVRARVVALQIGGGVALLYIAGLAHQSFVRLTQIDPGFSAQRLYAVPVPFPIIAPGTDQDSWRRAERQNDAVARQWLAEVSALPGVESAAFADTWPMMPLSSYRAATPSGNRSAQLTALRLSIGLGYPQTIGARMLAGREATEDETHARNGADGIVVTALVNRTLANLIGPGGSAIGQRLSLTSQFSYHIVGVIDDVKQGRADRPSEPTIYPYIPATSYAATALVRVRDPAQVLPRIEDSIRRSWGADRVPRNIISVERAFGDATLEYRVRSQVMRLAVIMCFPITLLAIYGAASYDVEQRTRSIAIEMACGATPVTIGRDVLRRISVGALQGIALGLCGSAVIGRLLASRVFGVAEFDPILAAAVGGLTLLVVWLGALWPAWQATRVSPASALRHV